MNRRSWLLFSAMCLIWGIPYLLIRISVESVSPVFLVFARTAIGALLLMPLAAVRGQLRVVVPSWRSLLLYTAAEIVVPWLLLSEAERHITSSLSGLLVAAVPLVATVIAWVIGRQERLSPYQLLGLVVGLAGVATVLGSDLGTLNLASGAEMAVVVVGYAAGPQVLARRLSHLPGLGVVACSLTVGALVYLPIAILLRPTALPPTRALGSLLVLGVVCTAAAFVVFFSLIGAIGAVRATVITYVNPAVAVVLGVAILHEHFTSLTGLGFLLILGGSVLATRRRPVRTGGAPTPAQPATAGG